MHLILLMMMAAVIIKKGSSLLHHLPSSIQSIQQTGFLAGFTSPAAAKTRKKAVTSKAETGFKVFNLPFILIPVLKSKRYPRP